MVWEGGRGMGTGSIRGEIMSGLEMERECVIWSIIGLEWEEEKKGRKGGPKPIEPTAASAASTVVLSF